MAEPYRARKHRKQQPFLKAFERMGKITLASRAVRISRDAVHDWRRHDPVFAGAFLIAKEKYQHFKTRGWIVFSMPAHSRPMTPPALLSVIGEMAYPDEQRRRRHVGLYDATLT